MNPTNRSPGVIEAASQAVERVKSLLFRPFDLVRWLVIGFGAWLSMLGEASVGGASGGGSNGKKPAGFNEIWDQATDYVRTNLAWIVVATVVLVVVVVVLDLLLTWLSSRGRFVFLHNVTTGRAEIQAPWNEYAREGNSLFVFRAVFGLGTFLVSLPFAIAGVWAVISMMRQEALAAFPLLIAIGTTVTTVVLGIAFLLVGKLTTDFVVPIMMLRRSNWRSAWGEFVTLLRSHPGSFLLFLLFGMVLDFAASVAVVVAMILCCPLCCVLALPYINTVILLPLHVFFRSYSAEFLAQFGTNYSVFPPLTPPCAAPPDGPVPG